MAFNYVNIVGKECLGWLNLFFDDECVAMVNDVELADRIRKEIPEKQYMKKRKLPYGEIARLADISGYTPIMISKMLSGERRGWRKSEKLKRLCSATGTTTNLWRYGTPKEILAGILAAEKKMRAKKGGK